MKFPFVGRSQKPKVPPPDFIFDLITPYRYSMILKIYVKSKLIDAAYPLAVNKVAKLLNKGQHETLLKDVDVSRMECFNIPGDYFSKLKYAIAKTIASIKPQLERHNITILDYEIQRGAFIRKENLYECRLQLEGDVDDRRARSG